MKKIMLITIIALLPFLNHAQGSEAKKSIKPTCISGDCKNGKGVLIYASGNRYEGDFKDGKIHGIGTLYNSKNKILKKGRWEKGEYVGP